MVFSSCAQSTGNEFATKKGLSKTDLNNKPVQQPRTEKKHSTTYYGYNNYNFDSLFAAHDNGKIFPKDESFLDPSLEKFISNLKQAVQNKDADFIISHLYFDIRNSWAGIPDGISAFKERWGYKNNQFDDYFWESLEFIIELGGYFDYVLCGNCDSTLFYHVPYVDIPYPLGDPFIDQLVISENVALYSEPSINSSILGYLSYDIVHVDYQGSGVEQWLEGVTVVDYDMNDWARVITLDSSKGGYIDAHNIYSPLGFRFYIAKDKGTWLFYGLFLGE
jgi:hypothetical protein